MRHLCYVMGVMKILVTGGAGFIGSHVADQYLTQGHEVVIVDDLSTGKFSNINKAAKFVKLDITNATAVEKLFQKEKFDLVNHHAAQIDVRKSVSTPDVDAHINIIGTLNLLQSCVKYGGGSTTVPMIFASSGGVIYGEAMPSQKFPIPEEAPKRPLSHYGVAKLAAEYYLYCYRQMHGLNYIALRYGNVYGPRQDPKGEAGVIAIFLGQMLRQGRGLNEPPTIFGTGEQTRDYVYIEDVVEANLRATEKLSAVSYQPSASIDDLAFNIATGKATSVNELFVKLKEIVSYKGEPQYGPPRAGELQRNALDITKAGKLLGWRPHYDLEAGLEKTAQWMRH